MVDIDVLDTPREVDEYSDNDSKVSLVRVCNSIERKVKKIWE